jgi:dTDP-4-amino-4,6-dideoxygalactose transaminase
MNSYKHFGMDLKRSKREEMEFNIVGTNYKLSNVQAAVGLGQLKDIDVLLERRRYLAARYNSFFSAVEGVRLPEIHKDAVHSWQTYCILTESRDKIMGIMREEGTEVQIGTYSLHMHKAFQDKNFFSLKGRMNGSTQSYKQCLALPLFHDLSGTEQDYIVKRIKDLI